ncbi:MAG: hypothetical protein QM811_09600 [Pirellulales bacterium]
MTNTGKEAATIPALLTDGKSILWANSLLIQSQKKVYRCPGETPPPANVASATLPPNESVSTVVDVLKLKGPDWPRGGSRIEFQFCLGELSKTKSLYYFSNHHDPIRDAAQKNAGN